LSKSCVAKLIFKDFSSCQVLEYTEKGPWKSWKSAWISSSLKGGDPGSRKRSSGKPLKFTLLHFSICSKLVRNFSNTFGFVILCRYASLLNYDIFIQPGTPSNWSKCQMYNNNENWSYFVLDILIYLEKLLKIISLFPQNLGVQRRPFFVLGASQDAWTPFWLNACRAYSG
jgi:hypothetical protein